MLLIFTRLHGFFFAVLVIMHPSSPQWNQQKTWSLFAFSSVRPLSLVINHNLFPWLLPCCSGSLSTICPCVPSGVCVLSEDYRFVNVAYFYAKQIFPHRVQAWQNGDRTTIREKVGQGALKGGGFGVSFFFFFVLFFASREVMMTLADNNIGSICVPAISAGSINRTLSVGALWVKMDCFVKKWPRKKKNLHASQNSKKWSSNSTNKNQPMLLLAVNDIFPSCHHDLWNRWRHSSLASLAMCVKLICVHGRSL